MLLEGIFRLKGSSSKGDLMTLKKKKDPFQTLPRTRISRQNKKDDFLKMERKGRKFDTTISRR